METSLDPFHHPPPIGVVSEHILDFKVVVARHARAMIILWLNTKSRTGHHILFAWWRVVEGGGWRRVEGAWCRVEGGVGWRVASGGGWAVVSGGIMNSRWVGLVHGGVWTLEGQ